jgi:hypothetical protein
MACAGRTGDPRGVKPWVAKHCGAGLEPEGGKAASFGRQEGVGGDAEHRVVVEAPPVVAFVVAEAKLVLELLVAAKDAPAELREAHQLPFSVGSGTVESQHMAGSLVPSGHSVSSRSTGRGSFRSLSRCVGLAFRVRSASAASPCFLPPPHLALGVVGQARRQPLDGYRSVLIVALQTRRWSVAPLLAGGSQRLQPAGHELV